jgi:hypothetical protein
MFAIEATLTASEGGIKRADVRISSIDNECRRPMAQSSAGYTLPFLPKKPIDTAYME